LVMAEEALHGVLGHHVQPDRRFVQEQDLGRVEQGGDQFHFHALAQRQLADRLAEQVAHAEHGGKLIAGPLEAGGLDAVDLLVQAERLGGRQVPPELVLLAHHQGEPPPVGVFALPGEVAEDAGRPRRRGNHAGKELERGGLACPVRAEEGDELTLIHAKVDGPDRLDRAVLAAKQPDQRGPKPLFLLVHHVGLRESLDFDDRHDSRL